MKLGRFDTLKKMASSLILLFLLAASVQVESLPIYFPKAQHRDLPNHLAPLAAQEESQHSRESKITTTYTTHFFLQTLDHFNYRPQSYKVFNQKYLLNTQFWDKGPDHSAPIFVYTGNEGDIGWFADNTGFLPDIAPRFQALLVFIEHRFYGDSLPFGNKSYDSAETLGYLNSAQALADYATLITSLKHNLSAEASPVVVFGGSYAGMLSAWFRLKYPHIAIGALASSAPILQFEKMTPWSSFYYGVSQDFKDESLNCFDVIKGCWDELMAMEKPKGLRKLSKAIRSCRPLHSVYSARSWLEKAFVYTAMMDYPTAANFMNPLPAYPVKEMCRIIDTSPPKASKLEKAIAAASLYYNYTESKTCFELVNDDDPHGLNLWNWQVCTEMVMPMTISNETMFPPSTYDYKEFEDGCFERNKIRPRPHWITTEYGGHRIEQVLKRFGSNIIFSNGMRDPWSRGGVLRNISDSIVALVTKQGAHHVDFRSATKEDPEWLVQLRRQEVEILQKWIDQYYSDMKSY